MEQMRVEEYIPWYAYGVPDLGYTMVSRKVIVTEKILFPQAPHFSSEIHSQNLHT